MSCSMSIATGPNDTPRTTTRARRGDAHGTASARPAGNVREQMKPSRDTAGAVRERREKEMS
jgi:hypothetical protein